VSLSAAYLMTPVCLSPDPLGRSDLTEPRRMSSSPFRPQAGERDDSGGGAAGVGHAINSLAMTLGGRDGELSDRATERAACRYYRGGGFVAVQLRPPVSATVAFGI
jgi:hypothetical protein